MFWKSLPSLLPSTVASVYEQECVYAAFCDWFIYLNTMSSSSAHISTNVRIPVSLFFAELSPLCVYRVFWVCPSSVDNPETQHLYVRPCQVPSIQQQVRQTRPLLPRGEEGVKEQKPRTMQILAWKQVEHCVWGCWRLWLPLDFDSHLHLRQCSIKSLYRD